jgi:phosphoribosylformimino-5-aminoimidazole carboxamide ribotide isomerase
LLVIPAIDVKDGRCVRLRQGIMSEETVFSDHPEEMALRWYDQGAKRLHLVDLNGAVEGRPINRDAIRKIIQSVPIPVELGGGIRDMETLEAYLALGVHLAILGTVAYRDPDFVYLACRRFPGQIMLGIDARDDRVAVMGWTEETTRTPVQMAQGFEGIGVASIVYTDIQRDGMGTGPNIERTGALARSIGIPVIASGGISGLEDVQKILSLRKDGVTGMITGRALYDGRLDLAEAIRAAGENG